MDTGCEAWKRSSMAHFWDRFAENFYNEFERLLGSLFGGFYVCMEQQATKQHVSRIYFIVRGAAHSTPSHLPQQKAWQSTTSLKSLFAHVLGYKTFTRACWDKTVFLYKSRFEKHIWTPRIINSSWATKLAHAQPASNSCEWEQQSPSCTLDGRVISRCWACKDIDIREGFCG